MFRYSSNITILLYNDLEYGTRFVESVLDLPLVMDHGFAKVFQINETSFLGMFQLKEETIYSGNTIVSLNTHNLKKELDRISKLQVFNLTEIQHIEQVPVDSFFFEDREGHDFEIIQFLGKEDQKKF